VFALKVARRITGLELYSCTIADTRVATLRDAAWTRRKIGRGGRRRSCLENRPVKVKNFVSRVSISRSASRPSHGGGRGCDGRGWENLRVTGRDWPLSPALACHPSRDCGNRNHRASPKSPEADRRRRSLSDLVSVGAPIVSPIRDCNTAALDPRSVIDVPRIVRLPRSPASLSEFRTAWKTHPGHPPIAPGIRGGRTRVGRRSRGQVRGFSRGPRLRARTRGDDEEPARFLGSSAACGCACACARVCVIPQIKLLVCGVARLSRGGRVGGNTAALVRGERMLRVARCDHSRRDAG